MSDDSNINGVLKNIGADIPPSITTDQVPFAVQVGHVPTKPDEFFVDDKPKTQSKTTIIIIVSFVLIILAIIFMGYIIKHTDYSQMYTNLIILVSAIIAVTTVLLV
jgi:hypothetical protein